MRPKQVPLLVAGGPGSTGNEGVIYTPSPTELEPYN